MTAPRKLLRSTAFRLSLIYAALFGAACALAVAYIYWHTTVLVSRQLDQTIEVELRGLAEQYRSGGIRRLAQIVAERSATPGSSLYLVADERGRRIAGNLRTVSPALWDSAGRVEFTYRRPAAEGGHENRQAAVSVIRLPDDYRLIVGRDIEDRRALQRLIRTTFLWGLGFMAVVGLGGGLLMGLRLMRRIEAVSDASRTIMAGDLSQRIPVIGAGDEFDRLAESLNAMLARIEELMAGLKEVSDNIAHDLKTPLNRLRNRLEAVLRGGAGEAAYREALQETIEDADELMRIFEALLSIARLEAGAGGESRGRFDLGAVLRDVCELYEPLAEERGLSLVAETGAPLWVIGERQLVAQAVANLIDNAIKYSAAPGPCANGRTGRIAVALARCGPLAEISVADRGPGINAADRERAVRRFVRLEASRSRSGSGLGLSLAAAVARLHGGAIRLEDNEPGLRVVFSMRLGDDRGEGAASRHGAPADIVKARRDRPVSP